MILDDFNYEDNLKCPVCEHDNVHIAEVVVIPNNDEYEWNGIKKWFRGNGFAVSYLCEGGHEWAEVTAFHKGMCWKNVFISPKGIEPEMETTREEDDEAERKYGQSPLFDDFGSPAIKLMRPIGDL